MKNLITTSLVILYTCLLAIGQDFTYNVSSDSILFGNYISLSYSLENIDGKFEAPAFQNIEVLSGPNTSSSIQIVNGDKTSMTTYTYHLKPIELGRITIPPAYVVTTEKTLEAAPIELNVYPNPENIIVQPDKKHNSSFFELRNFNPFNTTPTPPETPAIQEKPKRKYKKI